MKIYESMSVIMRLMLFIFITLIIGSGKLSACDISFIVTQNNKEKYEIGDTIVVKVIVILTHRICPEGILKTQFQTSGLKVIGAKQWVEVKMGVYERELKILVTGTTSGKVSISAIRKCEKEGGFGTLELKAEPIKH